VTGCFQVIQQNHMLCPELFAKRRSVYDPRQIGRFDSMIDHRSCNSETRRLNCIRHRRLRFQRVCQTRIS